MVEEVKEVRDKGKDPVVLAVDTPPEKLPQFTIIPTGAVNAFAMSKTIQQFGKRNAFNGLTPMEYYMNKIFEYNRSRGGTMLAGLMRLAQTKVEVTADQAAEGRKLIAGL
jgi:hypothetical protein